MVALYGSLEWSRRFVCALMDGYKQSTTPIPGKDLIFGVFGFLGLTMRALLQGAPKVERIENF